MDRKEIIQKFIEKTQENIDSQKARLKKTEKSRREAPGFMESASDTTRSEKEMESANINSAIKKLKKAKEELKSLIKKEAAKKAAPGSIIETENTKNNQKKYYLITENAGGIILTDIGVSSVSKEAPLFEYLIGKKEGDTINFRNNEMNITRIF